MSTADGCRTASQLPCGATGPAPGTFPLQVIHVAAQFDEPRMNCDACFSHRLSFDGCTRNFRRCESPARRYGGKIMMLLATPAEPAPVLAHVPGEPDDASGYRYGLPGHASLPDIPCSLPLQTGDIRSISPPKLKRFNLVGNHLAFLDSLCQEKTSGYPGVRIGRHQHSRSAGIGNGRCGVRPRQGR
jgi:hypothetical protein